MPDVSAPESRSLRFEVSAETSATPEQVIELAGTDFTPRRSKVWPNVRASRLIVHDQGTDWADVTEGGTGPAHFVWERSRYDWSQPGKVTAKVIDSNAFLPETTFELRATPHDGGSTVVMILDRSFRSGGWGRVGYLLNRVFGARGFAFMLRQMVKAVEKQAPGLDNV
jgi:hypothetical protein